ncbi:MAG: IgA Peptidase M64 [Acidobacteria bacterium]|nr:IgA Peptidase M64 [Acidobacteriota bacterium]
MTYRPILVALILLAVPTALAHEPSFAKHFTDKTMRLDYFHTGGMGEEIVALDRIVNDGPWPGSRTQLIDTTNLGNYFFEVVDPESNQVIYSRGFGSIFDEWTTTSESRRLHRTFHESLRFPWPRHPVQVTLKRRRGETGFREVWSTRVDPDSRFVNPTRAAASGRVHTLLDSGPPATKVDLLLIAEGYTAAEESKFLADSRRLLDALFREEPFSSRKKDFNVRALHIPSAQSGISRPRAGQFRRTPVSAEYNIFDSERYMLTYDNRSLRDAASAAPYEFIEILANEEQYGGGGIFNFQATTSVDTAFAEYVFVHEFGHHFAALADEYYTSPVSYETGGDDHPEPWEPNVTALHDPDNLKWKDLVDPATPVPTPWPKEEFDRMAVEFQERRAALREAGAPEAKLNALFLEQQQIFTKFLGEQKYSGVVGAFEGASYEPTGLYRPEIDCIMFTRDEVGFCAVCNRALTRIIDLYSR